MKLKSVLSGGAIVMCFFIFNELKGQNYLAAENSIQISGKAKRGYLGNVVTDDAKQQLDLVFITKSTARKVKFHSYQFNYDLKLINEIDDEQEMDRARSKYSWFNFDGREEYTVNTIGIEARGSGTIFTKKEITYKYNWWTGKYKRKEKVLDKVKPKDEQGKLQFFASYNIDEAAEAIALVSHKPASMKDYGLAYQNYSIITINGDLETKSEEKLDFPFIKYPIWSGPVRVGVMEEDDAETGDWVILFAPMAGQGFNKWAGDDPMQWTYVRVGRDGKIKDRIDFKAKSHSWKVIGAYEKDGTVVIHGPSEKKGLEKTFSKTGDASVIAMKEKGFECFTLLGVKGGKVIFVNAPSIDEFKEKNVKPDNQKKPVQYTGGKINIGGLNITKSGDIFINAQEYGYDAVGNYRGNRYQDFLMFHFNSQGELVKCYGIDNPQKVGLKGVADPRQDPKYYPTESSVFEGSDGKSVYWMMYAIGNIERREIKDGSWTYTWWTPRKQVRIGKIDMAQGKVENFYTLGDGKEGKNKFYLMNEHPYVEINGGKQLVFIGEDTNIWGKDSSGDYIYLGKFDPANMK